MKTAVGSNGQMGQSNPVTDGEDMDFSNEDYSEEENSGSDLSDENMDGVDSGETNQEDLTEDGMRRMSQMLMAAKMSSEERRMHSDS